MPKRVAEAFPDFNFYCIEQTDAYGVAANSEATMKNGEFVCVSGDSDGNFGNRVIGHIIDGNIVFQKKILTWMKECKFYLRKNHGKQGASRPLFFVLIKSAVFRMSKTFFRESAARW